MFVNRYNFSSELNAEGRFVLIFESGFEEAEQEAAFSDA